MVAKLFGKKPAPAPAPVINAVQINNRINLLEEKTSNLNKKFEVLERNLLENLKKFNNNFHSLDTEFIGVKREINDLRQKLDLVIKELKMSAGKDELNTLKKYLDLWNPSQFATREEVEKIIKENRQKNL